MNQQGYLKASGCPIFVKMHVYVQIPKSASKSKQTSLENVFHTRARPGDCDNIFKFYSDVMNTVVYDDDRQICKLNVEKRYSSIPRVEIEVNNLA
jgi:Holliday junction resolvase RusA-like endonuclease